MPILKIILTDSRVKLISLLFITKIIRHHLVQGYNKYEKTCVNWKFKDAFHNFTNYKS